MNREGTRSHKGEKNPHSVLSDDVVRQIRADYAAGGVSMLRIAARLGISSSTVQRIIRGEAWGHVE